MTRLTKLVNPLLSPIASTGLIGVWGVIHHTGDPLLGGRSLALHSPGTVPIHGGL